MDRPAGSGFDNGRDRLETFISSVKTSTLGKDSRLLGTTVDAAVTELWDLGSSFCTSASKQQLTVNTGVKYALYGIFQKSCQATQVSYNARLGASILTFTTTH